MHGSDGDVIADAGTHIATDVLEMLLGEADFSWKRPEQRLRATGFYRY